MAAAASVSDDDAQDSANSGSVEDNKQATPAARESGEDAGAKNAVTVSDEGGSIDGDTTPNVSSAHAKSEDVHQDSPALGCSNAETRPCAPKSDRGTIIADSDSDKGHDDEEAQQQAKQSQQASAEATNPRHNDRLILEKFVLYKTESRMYVVACDQHQSQYRILKIDRHYSPTDTHHELGITQDGMTYTKAEVSEVIRMIGDGNKTVGGCQMVVANFFGIIGFVRFTAGWHLILVKKRLAVGLVGGHYIYHCEEAQTVPISNNAKPEKPSEETRLYNAFTQVDLSKNFYFSYSYDLTNTLQTNLTRPLGKRAEDPAIKDPKHWVAEHADHAPASLDGARGTKQMKAAWGFNDKFIWNHYLLRPAFADSIKQQREASCWVLPLVHGFVDQTKLSIFGRTVYVTLIGRRSRYFAGARFLKRGVNDEGNVANDVETEQLVHEALTTSFYTSGANGKARQPNNKYTSYVQHRGSIPLSWQQDTSTSTMKPPIHLHLVDPYHSAAALHFDDLFSRYGTPIIVLNLIKNREHEAREQKLIKPYNECINYLNQFLPEDKKIKVISFDMSAAYKNRSMDVIGILEDIGEEVVETTKFFHSGGEPAAYSMRNEGIDSSEPNPYRSTPLLQHGVCRTNCIDCLDRTNAAQFVIAKAAFAHQLHALGILSVPHLPYENDAVNMLTEMYHDHGDTIALQYGGSHLVNTMNTYRKINQWSSHSRDMVEGIKRFYANVALDQDKQNSINLFLGIDAKDDMIAGYAGGAPPIPPSKKPTGEEGSVKSEKGDPQMQILKMPIRARRDYRHWYTPEYVNAEVGTDQLLLDMQSLAEREGDRCYHYYRTRLFTNLERHFAFRVNSTSRYNIRMHGDRFVADTNELSPFKSRATETSHAPRLHVGVKRWMSVNSKRSSRSASDQNQSPSKPDEPDHPSTDEVALPPATTTEGLAMRLLRPRVNSAEAEEYASYVDQYRNLNLSNELQYEHSAADMQIYERSVQICRGEAALPELLHVDSASEDLYEKHVRSVQEQSQVQGRWSDTASLDRTF